MDARIAKMVELVTWFCGSANLGYDQWNRWDFPEVGDTQTPGECDCSSLVYHCAELAGFNVPKSGTRYTGTMRRDFLAAGFVWLAGLQPSEWLAGDILYKDGHTAIYTGKYIAEAYGDEHGADHGGQTGDQNDETRLSPIRGGWLGVFRMLEPAPVPEWPQKPEEGMVACDFIIEEGSNHVPHEYAQTAYCCRWQKWASGRLTAQVSDWFGGGTGSKYEGQFYLSKVLEMPHTACKEAPAYIEPPFVKVGCIRASRGWISELQITALTAEKMGFWAFGTSKNLPKFYVDFELDGCWK